MNHSQSFLEQIRARHELRPSKYALARHMRDRYGWAIQTTRNYLEGKTHPSEPHALDIAAELELGAGYVLACVAADRARDDQVRSRWEAAAEALRRSAAAVIVSAAGALVGWVGIPSDSMAYASSASGSMNQTSYTLRALLQRLRAWLAGLADEADALELA